MIQANTFGRRSAIVDSRSGDFGAHQAGITAARVVTLQDEMLDVCITCPHASWVEGATHRAALPGLEALETDGFGLLEHWSLLGTRHCWGTGGCTAHGDPCRCKRCCAGDLLGCSSRCFFSLWLAATHLAGWCGGSCGSDKQDSVRV